ncbi:uncharacterized protein LODBEIA_P22990 [Lodderomyces beijingensis]|uniref:candidapepsin n=1 Tax=Lodderomyces beijingensis TaxID=1775926 RepID=A0ABP0ZLK0_9ASCO
MKVLTQLPFSIAALSSILCIASARPSLGKDVNHDSIEAKRDSPGFYKIDFNVRRGSSRADLSPRHDQTPRFVKRADGAGDFTLQISNQQTFYMADLYIGSNEDKNQVLVDTGSSDLWVMSHDLNCLPRGTTLQKRDPKNVFRFGTGATFPKDVDEKTGKKRKRDAGGVELQELDFAPTKVQRDDDGSASGNVYTTIYFTGTSLPSEFSSLFPDGPGGGGFSSALPGSAPSASAGSGSGSGGTNTCTSYGSFNTENSDSFVQNRTSSFLIQYADGTHALGIWGHDTVKLGNVSVPNLSFAVANETSSDIGVLGIGLPGLQTTTQYGYMYENLPLKLKSDGIIDKVVFSLYLARASDSAGSVLFGAVDHAKYEGSLTTVPMLRTYQQIPYPVRFEVEVTNIAFNNSGNQVTIDSSSMGVVLDSGSTLSYLRSSQIQSIASQLNGRYSSSAGAYLVDCSLQSSRATLDIEFTSKVIRVPVSDLIFPASRTQCFLGLSEQSQSSNYILFGDNVLRSAYVVYDLENYSISLAQAYYTNDEDIEVITDTIPLSGGQNASSVGTGSGSSSSSGGRQNSASSFVPSFTFIVMGFIASMSLML